MDEILDVLEGRKRWCVVTGDCLEIMPHIPRGSVAAVVTDPPYSSGGAFRGDRTMQTGTKYSQVHKDGSRDFTGDSRDQRSFSYWCALWLSQGMRVTAASGFCCLFTDWRQLPSTTDAIQCGGWVWRGIAVWDKDGARPVPGRFRAQAEFVVWGTNGPHSIDSASDGVVYGSGVFRESCPRGDDRVHLTQKPVGVMEDIVRVASPHGGVVLDPFCGSGTTGVAALRTGSRFIGIEMGDAYADMARKRLAEADAATALMAGTA